MTRINDRELFAEEERAVYNSEGERKIMLRYSLEINGAPVVLWLPTSISSATLRVFDGVEEIKPFVIGWRLVVPMSGTKFHVQPDRAGAERDAQTEGVGEWVKDMAKGIGEYTWVMKAGAYIERVGQFVFCLDGDPIRPVRSTRTEAEEDAIDAGYAQRVRPNGVHFSSGAEVVNLLDD